MRLLECLGAETGNFRSLRAEKEGWLDGAWGLIGEERNRERALVFLSSLLRMPVLAV